MGDKLIRENAKFSQQIQNIDISNMSDYQIQFLNKKSEFEEKLKCFNDLFEFKNQNSQIFQKLSDDVNIQNKEYCKVGSCQFSMMKLKKQCKFCGNAVCYDHSLKRRKNPQPEENENLYRICDNCEEEYNKKQIFDEFNNKLQQMLDEIQLNEKLSTRNLNQVKSLEEIHYSIQHEVNFAQINIFNYNY